MGGVGLFTLFSNPNGPLNANGATASQAWMLFQAGPGIEYIFTDEMSFQFDAGALAMLDFKNQARFSYVAKLSYLFYF